MNRIGTLQSKQIISDPLLPCSHGNSSKDFIDELIEDVPLKMPWVTDSKSVHPALATFYQKLEEKIGHIFTEEESALLKQRMSDIPLPPQTATRDACKRFVRAKREEFSQAISRCYLERITEVIGMVVNKTNEFSETLCLKAPNFNCWGLRCLIDGRISSTSCLTPIEELDCVVSKIPSNDFSVLFPKQTRESLENRLKEKENISASQRTTMESGFGELRTLMRAALVECRGEGKRSRVFHSLEGEVEKEDFFHPLLKMNEEIPVVSMDETGHFEIIFPQLPFSEHLKSDDRKKKLEELLIAVENPIEKRMHNAFSDTMSNTNKYQSSSNSNMYFREMNTFYAAVQQKKADMFEVHPFMTFTHDHKKAVEHVFREVKISGAHLQTLMLRYLGIVALAFLPDEAQVLPSDSQRLSPTQQTEIATKITSNLNKIAKHPFLFYAFSNTLFSMFTRYETLFDTATKQDNGKGLQSATPPAVHETLSKLLNFKCLGEIFASPFNAQHSRFCSIFPLLDSHFGSRGGGLSSSTWRQVKQMGYQFTRPNENKFQINLPILSNGRWNVGPKKPRDTPESSSFDLEHHYFLVNPPFELSVAERAVKNALQTLNEVKNAGGEMGFLFVLPVWDADYEYALKDCDPPERQVGYSSKSKDLQDDECAFQPGQRHNYTRVVIEIDPKKAFFINGHQHKLDDKNASIVWEAPFKTLMVLLSTVQLDIDQIKERFPAASALLDVPGMKPLLEDAWAPPLDCLRVQTGYQQDTRLRQQSHYKPRSMQQPMSRSSYNPAGEMYDVNKHISGGSRSERERERCPQKDQCKRSTGMGLRSSESHGEFLSSYDASLRIVASFDHQKIVKMNTHMCQSNADEEDFSELQNFVNQKNSGFFNPDGLADQESNSQFEENGENDLDVESFSIDSEPQHEDEKLYDFGEDDSRSAQVGLGYQCN
eukprot:GDKJ01018500.1.p1 GENE.GDKJ01018500.1~~GDKJ01018500.1.p1  ORF type:complete len:992 (-),score=180.06 GDKJ01018500.1:48-2864(-)